MTLQTLRDALLTVTDKVYHFEATAEDEKYIVWTEDGQADTVWADGKLQQQAITGTIDYFTKEEFDENFDRIQKALSQADISFGLNSIQYEDDTSLIHYEWVWEIG